MSNGYSSHQEDVKVTVELTLQEANALMGVHYPYDPSVKAMALRKVTMAIDRKVDAIV